MSNPKLKAEELTHKFYEIENDSLYYGVSWRIAKQCALIAVDELIELAKYTDGYYGWVDYYEEVKQEIEKL